MLLILLQEVEINRKENAGWFFKSFHRKVKPIASPLPYISLAKANHRPWLTLSGILLCGQGAEEKQKQERAPATSTMFIYNGKPSTGGKNRLDVGVIRCKDLARGWSMERIVTQGGRLV